MALAWSPTAPQCRVCLDGHILRLLINWCLSWRQRSNALSLSACFPCQFSMSSPPSLTRRVWVFFFFQKCQEIVLKRVHRVSSPCWPAKRNNYVRQGVRSEGKLSSWPDRRSQDWFSRQHTFLFFFLFFCLFLCWAPYYLSFNSICGWLPHLLLPNLKNSLHQKGSFKGSLYSTSTTGNVS